MGQPVSASLGAITLAIKAFFHPEEAQGADETFELHLGEEILQVQVKDGALLVKQASLGKLMLCFTPTCATLWGYSPGRSNPARPFLRGSSGSRATLAR
jgi:hypothetical protein